MKRYFAILFCVCTLLLIVFSGRDITLLGMIKNANIDASFESDNLAKIDIDDLCSLLSSLDVEIVSKNKVEDRIIIEGYSPKINNGILVNGFKINLQLSISDNVVIVGSPLIYGSF